MKKIVASVVSLLAASVAFAEGKFECTMEFYDAKAKQNPVYESTFTYDVAAKKPVGKVFQGKGAEDFLAGMAPLSAKNGDKDVEGVLVILQNTKTNASAASIGFEGSNFLNVFFEINADQRLGLVCASGGVSKDLEVELPSFK